MFILKASMKNSTSELYQLEIKLKFHIIALTHQASPKPFVFKKANVKASLNFLKSVWTVGKDKIQEHVFAFGNRDSDSSFSAICRKRRLSFKPRGGISLQPEAKNKISLKFTGISPSSIS